MTTDKAGSVKDPEGEAENPAPMPQAQQGQNPNRKRQDDLAGNQGGTEGGGPFQPRE